MAESVISNMSKIPLFLLPATQQYNLPGPTQLALKIFERCKTVQNGGRIYVCPECGHRKIVYNPCNKRGCPTCGKKNQVQWAIKTKEKLLAIRHYHITISIPELFTDLWLKHKREVMDSLFAASKEAILSVGENFGLLLGALLVFQSHGRGLSYKPHMHCVLSSGGIDEQGVWHKLPNIPFEIISKTIAQILREQILKRIDTLDIPIEEDKSVCRRYRVFATIHDNNAEAIVDYLAKTHHGVSLDISQGIKKDGTMVEFSENKNGKVLYTKLTQTLFIERYFNHIPPNHSVTTRYCGLYANRCKAFMHFVRSQLYLEEPKEKAKFSEICERCHTVLLIEKQYSRNEVVEFSHYLQLHGPPEVVAI